MSFEVESISNFKLINHIDSQIESFKGDLTQLESAIGALVLGRHLGWKVLLLMHDKRTIRKYEKILGIDFREALPDIGEKADRSLAWRTAKKIRGYWKIVKGEVKGVKSPMTEDEAAERKTD